MAPQAMLVALLMALPLLTSAGNDTVADVAASQALPGGLPEAAPTVPAAATGMPAQTGVSVPTPELQPGVPLAVTLTKDAPVAYSLTVPQVPQGKEAEQQWRLQVRQCYGRVAVSLPDANPPIDTKNAANDLIPLAGSTRALITPLAPLPVTYEITLLPPGSTAPIALPNPPRLAKSSWNIPVVEFERASSPPSFNGVPVNVSYSLVLVPKANKNVNPSAACGLTAALSKGEAEASPLNGYGVENEKHKAVWRRRKMSGRRLYATVPTSNEHWANVLVNLVDFQGNVLASSSYDPLDLSLRPSLREASFNVSATGILLILGLGGLGFACFAQGARIVYGKDKVEVTLPKPYKKEYLELTEEKAPDRDERADYRSLDSGYCSARTAARPPFASTEADPVL